MSLILQPARNLGTFELLVSAQGLGCMGMTGSYGPAERSASIETIRRAVELGVNFFDTANIYGAGANEELLADGLGPDSTKVVVATKFGIVTDPAQPGGLGYCGRPEYVRDQCTQSLRRLRRDHIDLYYLHRIDYSVPLEDTIGAMAELVEGGKVRHIGLSEANSSNIRRAHAVHPIAALQTEWSLWSRDIETDILPTCRELGISLVPYAPLGRGFLSGQVARPEQLAPKDSRLKQPRFRTDNFDHNLRLVKQVVDMAADLDCTAGQLALAWLHHQGQDVVPLPGTTQRAHLEENVKAASLSLSAEDLRRLTGLGMAASVAGARAADPTFINR